MGKEKPLPIPAPYTAPPDPPDPAEALNARLIALENRWELHISDVRGGLDPPELEKPKPVTP